MQGNSTPEGTRRVDVVVVGAGQAGLVTGYFLQRTGCDFVLYERAPRIGDAWRHRYDALVLFSPRASSALPGLLLRGDPEGYPTKDEVAAYLEAYARTFHLPVRTAEGIVSVERRASHFLARTTTPGTGWRPGPSLSQQGPFSSRWCQRGRSSSHQTWSS